MAFGDFSGISRSNAIWTDGSVLIKVVSVVLYACAVVLNFNLL